MNDPARAIFGGQSNGGFNPMQTAQQAPQAYGAQAAPQGAAPQGQQDAQLTNPMLPPPTQSNPTNYPGADSTEGAMFNRGLALQKKGLYGEADETKRAADEAAAFADHNAALMQAHQASYQEHLGQLDNERKSLASDIQNGHIDPQHYWNSKSTGSQISTVLGLIVGGLGGPDNQAINFLNKNIDNDINAQKAELGKKENLLSMNLQQFGNLHAAEAATRLMSQDIAGQQMLAMAQRSGSAQAINRANAMWGAHLQSSAPEAARIANVAALGKLAKTNPEAAISIGIQDPAERKEARTQLENATKLANVHKTIDSITKELAANQTAAARFGDPIQSRRNIERLKAELVPLIMESNPSKRLTEESARLEIEPLIQGFMDNPDTASKLTASLHRLADTHSDKPTILDGRGIPYPKYSAPVTVPFRGKR